MSNNARSSADLPRLVGDDDESISELEDQEDLFNDTKSVRPVRWGRTRLAVAFFLFGLLNNVLYVIILSAAIDLVPASVPKGLVAFFNIFPALIAKVGWPYISDGNIRYHRRIYACAVCSWLGMIIIALSPTTTPRLLGISLASFSSGLGELTFLQLTTTLPSAPLSRDALGAWSSGTGGAGIVGAGLWWVLRGLGVMKGLGIASFLPVLFPVALLVVLPPFERLARGGGVERYEPIFMADDDASEVDIPVNGTTKTDQLVLTLPEKIALAKPLVMKYMLWLFLVYVFEYVCQSGVSPTLIFPTPTTGLWSHVFSSGPRSFYPFWALTYQSAVFISRSSLSLRMPPLPRSLLPLPAIIQLGVLVLLSLQASVFIFSPVEYRPSLPHAETVSWWSSVLGALGLSTASAETDKPPGGSDPAITAVFLLIALEGLMGGTAYCHTFWHVGREGDAAEGEGGKDEERIKMEKAFRIGACGAADSLGILVAALISMPVEVGLCNAQVKAGRTFCKGI